MTHHLKRIQPWAGHRAGAKSARFRTGDRAPQGGLL